MESETSTDNKTNTNTKNIKTKSKEVEQRFDDYRKRRKRLSSSMSPSFDEQLLDVVPTHHLKLHQQQQQQPTNINTLVSHSLHSHSHSHGFISVIGRRRMMEDAVTVVPGFMTAVDSFYGGGGYDFFAVYDGHGGTLVANACRDRLHLLLAEEMTKVNEEEENNKLDWNKVMSSCFMKMDMEIGVGAEGKEDDKGGNTMGSTAAVVVVGKEEIVVANCGDSRAVLCRGGAAVPLSRDHKPDRPDEKERIEAAGGIVIDWDGNRVLGVLATSRSIGDHCMKPFVISQPEIKVYERTELDEFVVIASDGLWDVVSNNCACEVVRNCLHAQMKKNFKDECVKSNATEAAALLAELAMARGSKDNISVIVIQLKNST